MRTVEPLKVLNLAIPYRGDFPTPKMSKNVETTGLNITIGALKDLNTPALWLELAA